MYYDDIRDFILEFPERMTVIEDKVTHNGNDVLEVKAHLNDVSFNVWTLTGFNVKLCNDFKLKIDERSGLIKMTADHSYPSTDKFDAIMYYTDISALSWK